MLIIYLLFNSEKGSFFSPKLIRFSVAHLLVKDARGPDASVTGGFARAAPSLVTGGPAA